MVQKSLHYVDLFNQPVAPSEYKHFKDIIQLMRRANAMYDEGRPETVPHILTSFYDKLREIRKKPFNTFDPTRTYLEGDKQVTPLWDAHKLMDKTAALRGFRDGFAEFYPNEVKLTEYYSAIADATEIQTQNKSILSQEELDKLYSEPDHTDMYPLRPRQF